MDTLEERKARRDGAAAERPEKRRRVQSGALASEQDESKSPADESTELELTPYGKRAPDPRSALSSAGYSSGGASSSNRTGLPRTSSKASKASLQEDAEDEDEEDDYDDDDEDEDSDDADGFGDAAGPQVDVAGSITEAYATLLHRMKFPDPGTIKSITLQNFMCHSNLQVDFKPNVNCIVGKNGSGKSSICAGIMMAFDSRVAATGRGSNMGSIVKHGCTEGRVVLVIHNAAHRGAYATPYQPYRPDFFGDRIVLTRRLRRSATGGTSQFTVSGSKHGAIVKGKEAREEIAQLRLHFQVDPENPMMVLTQEEAKKFATADGKKRYDLFLKATSLESAQANMVATAEKIDRLSEDKKKLQGEVDKAKAAFTKAEKKWNRFKGMQEIDANIKEAKYDVAFAELDEKEEQIEGMHQELTALKEKAGREERNIDKRIEREKELVAEIAELEAEMDQVAAKQEERSKEIEDLLVERDSVKKPMEACSTKAERYYAKQEKCEERLRKTRAEIAQLRSKMGRTDFYEQLEDLRKQSDRQRAKMDELEGEIKEAHEAVQQAKRSQSYLTADVSSAKQQCRESQEGIEGTKRMMAAIKRTSTSSFEKRVAALDNRGEVLELYRRVVGAVKAEKKPMPVGPIGAFIKLKDQRITPAVVSVLDDTINEFRSNTTALNAALRRAAPRVSLAVSRRFLTPEQVKKRYESTRVKPKGRDTIHTLHDFLTFEGENEQDVCVAEQTVLGRNTHKILVATDPEQGRDLMERYPDALGAVLPDGSRIQKRGESVSFMAISKAVRARFGGSAKESEGKLVEALTKQEEELAAAQSELQVAQAQMDRRTEHLRRNERKLKDLKTQFAAAKRALDKTKRAEKAVREQEKQEGDEELGQRVEMLEEEAERIESIVAKCKESVEGQGEKYAKLKEDLKPILEKIKHLKAMQSGDKGVRRITESLEGKQDELTQIRSKLHSKQIKLDQVRKAMAEHMQELSQLEASHKSGKDTLVAQAGRESFTGDAMTVQEARAKLKGLERLRESHARQLGHDPELVRQAEADFVKTQQVLVDTEARVAMTLRMLKGTRLMNARRFRGMRKLFLQSQQEAGTAFNRLMQSKGHHGKVRFEPTDKGNPMAGGKMELLVTPNVYQMSEHEAKQVMQTQARAADGLDEDDDMDDSSVHKDKKKKNIKSTTSSLSGGEKALTSLALLLAIGQQIELPWRAMDEFDVFMDEQTRKLSLQAILDTASSLGGNINRTGHQFILITPLDVSSADFSAYPEGFVNIFQLKEPKRTQRIDTMIRRYAAGGEDDVELYRM